MFLSQISFPHGPEYPHGATSNFYKNSRLYSNVKGIEEGRAASKKSSLKIWLFSFHFPARSFCRHYSKFSCSSTCCVTSRHHPPPPAPTPCVITELVQKYFLKIGSVVNILLMNIEINLEDVIGPPRSKKACVQL